MKRILVVACVLAIGGTAFAQEAEVTTVTTTEFGGDDLLSQLWNMEDATPLDPGQLDFRLGGHWVTESAPANWGDSDDDFILRPAIVWGIVDNLEMSLSMDAWLGDGGDMGPFEDGNYDTTIGFLWRFYEQQFRECDAGCLDLPSMALSASARVPTGDRSNGVDGELRLIMSYEYDNGIRSHLNIFGKSVNGDNQEELSPRIDDDALVSLDWDDWLMGEDPVDPRHFQWGVVLGADGPLCADGAVRWVLDYMHRNGEFYGRGDMDILELGWEWTMSEMHKLGMSMQVGLDHTDDNPNFGAGLMYALSLGTS